MDTQAVIYCHELVPQTCACATLVPRRHDRTSPNDRAARALILPLPCSRRTICCITSLRSSLRINKEIPIIWNEHVTISAFCWRCA